MIYNWLQLWTYEEKLVSSYIRPSLAEQSVCRIFGITNLTDRLNVK
jgi:hypothetical protein